ncbi:PIH1 domain-containing protein 1 [Agrilus planipennis]|uniref:PIH1 domain-containing protein 1 n=1 Tax=Agrilus planipennis TaxID=224129 RepID=A0A7F5R235_AGRPL|nr:PIH1 domain-containing protein 1 [Agrilus planipennis]
MESKLFLDADASILEKNLKIINDSEEEQFENFLHQTALPSRIVKPMPGFCIKSRELGTDTKLFINICQTDALPAPIDISEAELNEILTTDDPSQFRVPMSIGNVRTETDKKGNTAKAVDVAINSTFFNKVEQSSLFKDFLTAVAFEGVKNKYNIATTDERVILRNRKAFGTLQVHRIQQRDIEEKINNNKEKSIFNSITKTNNTKDIRPLIETISSTELENAMTGTKKPQYRLYKPKTAQNVLLGEFRFPDIFKSEELTLDVGEDRIILECKTRNYLLDIFLPCLLNQELVQSEFNIDSKILTITMPLKENVCS